MAQIRTKDTVDAVKELVSQLTPIYIIKEAINNGDGTFTLSTNRTYWLTINKRITIDSIQYRITAFEINVSIRIKPITTGDPIPNVTFFTIPAPLFFHGVTLMAIDEQGKPKDPTERTPFVWLYEILNETVIRDELDPWGRNSKPQLFFMDESSLSNWTSAQHKTNVIEPMRQAVELFFDKINDFEGDKYKEVLTWTETARANWGKFITDLGHAKKFFNEDLSGHEIGYDFTMSKTACSEEIITAECNIEVTATTTPTSTEGGSDGTATANVIGNNGLVTYLWTTPDGVIPAGEEIKQTATGLITGTYTVLATDSEPPACFATDSEIVVDGSFAPGDIAGLINNIDMRDTSTLNGGGGIVFDDPVEDIADLSMAGIDGNQPLLAKQSIWRTDHLFVDGINDFVNFGIGLSKLQNRTIFLLVEPAAIPTGYLMGDFQSTGSSRTAGAAIRMNANLLLIHGDGSNSRNTLGSSAVTTGFQLIMFKYASGDILEEIQINGIDETETDGGGTATTIAGPAYNSSLFRPGDVDSAYWGGKFYHRLIYNSKLSDANVDEITAWYRNEYPLIP